MPHSKVNRTIVTSGYKNGRGEFAEDESAEARIGAHVQPQPNGCWLYNGSPKRARVNVDGKHTKAYRYVYETLVGPIPEGFVLHHECETPGCVNPDHLLCCTPGEHMTRHAEMRKAKR